MKIDVLKLRAILEEIAKKINENQNYISTLDQNIGDGDHGYNMNRGFEAVLAIDYQNLDLKQYFALVGKTLMAKVGGASGPLYGMPFFMAANIVENQKYID